MCLSLSACTGRYAGFQNKMSTCGYPGATMAKLHSCMSGKITTSRKVGEQDFYNKSGQNMLQQLAYLKKQVAAGKITNKQANAQLQIYMQQQIQIERQQAQRAAAALILLAGVAVVANCAHNGGCGGSAAYNDNHLYRGNCQYSWQRAADGSLCGNRAAEVRPGGWEPYNYTPVYHVPAVSSAPQKRVKFTKQSAATDFGPCMFSWQRAKDGSKCGKRAVSVQKTRQTSFSE